MHDTCTLQCAVTGSPTTFYPSFSPLPAPLPGQPTTVIVQTTIAVAGVTATNFDSLKASLKTVFAAVLLVEESQLTLSYASSSRRFLSTGNVLVEIAAVDQAQSASVVSEIRSDDFATNLNTEITQEAVTNTALSAVTVTSVSPPVLVTTTLTPTHAPTTTTTSQPTTSTTTTIVTTASGSSTLFACFALVISAIIL